MTWHKVPLTVRSTYRDDVYKDIARVSPPDRGNLRYGRIHYFKSENGSGYFVLRGTTKTKRGFLLVDSETRKKLGVTKSEPTEFQVREACFIEEIFWGWNATDPVNRSSARLAVIALGLGVLSLALGGVGVWLGILALHGP